MSSDRPTPQPRSRRQFLQSSGVAAGAALGSLAAPLTAQAACAAAPQTWDQTTDVLVVGTGFAGLTAAIEARLAGAEVLVIDKMPVHGGNSIINGGDFCAAGTAMQKAAGINDSPELMLKDMLKAGNDLNHAELARLVAYQSAETLAWCQDFCGVQFTQINFHGGHSVKRAHQTVNASGSELVNKFMKKARELGVVVEQRNKLVRIVSDDKGRVLGVEVRNGYRFPNEQSGTPAFIKARRAVVLGSGGFSRDVALRTLQEPRLTERFESTNHPGATGEALLEACKAGAMTVQMDWIQLGPWTSPDEKGFGHVPHFCERLVGSAPMINPKTGKRFFKETGNRKERADAIIALGGPVLIFSDEPTAVRQVYGESLHKGVESGAVRKYATLEEVAKAYEMPLAPFLEEVAKWNSYVMQKKDPDFGCMIFPEATPVKTAPFYVARLWPKVHHTMGGLAINKEAQVINLDLKPMPGLYAAGEVTGAVHGAVRLGGVALADCCVFGRIAGRNAAKEKAWG
ncbi:MAG: flavocytochrome c [Rubrivivax sp.]|nr:flavocytochrome c [Rubrivivax sp.]